MPPTPLDQFRIAVMADAEVQMHLARAYDPALFEQRAIAWAASQGIAITAADLNVGFGTAPAVQPDWPLPGWLPARFVTTPEPAILWLHFAEISPSTPFFEDAIREVAGRPFNRLFRIATPLASFQGRAELRAPSGLIFHMSRCGSTLVSQMLAAAPGHVSISESPPIDALVQRRFPDPDAHADALRGLIHAYARDAEHLFLKLDSWHTRALPLLRRAFPDTPWIFLYRDPVEVMVSHMRQRGLHTVPGAVPLTWFGLTHEDMQLSERAFIAQILERTCRAVLQHDPGEGLLIDYAELPEAFFGRILPHFGVTPTVTARAAMASAAGSHSKVPGKRFDADGEAKQREADAELRAIAGQYVAPAFAELEARRAGASRQP